MRVCNCATVFFMRCVGQVRCDGERAKGGGGYLQQRTMDQMRSTYRSLVLRATMPSSSGAEVVVGAAVVVVVAVVATAPPRPTAVPDDPAMLPELCELL